MILGFVSADTTDTTFRFYNRDTVGYTENRTKGNETNTYVYPQSGPTINYTVQSKANGITNFNDRSHEVRIPTGTQGEIYNTARRGNHLEPVARLKMTTPNPNVNVYTTGVWSPDSSGSYTVYGNGYPY